MENLLFSINAVAPIFIVVFIGVFLKKRNVINDDFTGISSNVVFKVALPALLFRDVAATDIKSVFDLKLILFALAGTLAAFLLLTFFCTALMKEKTCRGAFVQGAFRSNYAIIGLPLAYNLFGQAGTTKSAVLLSFVIPLYNILAIIILTVTSPKSETGNYGKIAASIASNPLILAVIAAIPFSCFQITLPEFLNKSIDYFASLAMPLALLGMGGSFNFRNVKSRFSSSIAAAAIKIVATPLVFTTLAYFMGFRGEDLGAIFILFGSPTAVSSFIMAKSMDSDHELASHIVLMTTLGSIFTIFAGVYIIKTIGAI